MVDAARFWAERTASGRWFSGGGKKNLEFSSGEEFFEKGQLEPRSKWLLPTATLEEVESGIANGTAMVIDVRDAYRYRGESEPIDLVAGHIPGAVNIPFSENLDEKGYFLSSGILRKKYNFMNISSFQKIIVHCGSGVTACHTLLAMAIAGYKIPGLFIGSWSEWSRRGMPVAKEK